ncbi:MAG: chloride channel protein [Bdellovibrionota bacterium]
MKESGFTAYAKTTLMSVIVGVLAGIAATVFLYSLDLATRVRLAHPDLIYFLPLGGLALGWLYSTYGKDVAAGNNLILQEIHDPKKVLPLRMAPLVLAGTLVTHLFGGSAGREGTAVQMGATLADQLAAPFKASAAQRKILLVAGAGAGFGAAVGAPWAGMIFGMEVIRVGRLQLIAPFECFVASFVAYLTTRIFEAPHSLFGHVTVQAFSLPLCASVLAAGILFGLCARGFSALTHGVEALQRKYISYPPLKPFIGGSILVALFWLEGSFRFTGLGIDSIQRSFSETMSFADPIKKALFTAITLGTGFKGGEFVPLVFVGSTLGSALTQFLPMATGLAAALGFAAVFAGASNTPLACSIMAAELFGISIAPYALVACFASFYVSGRSGIYRAQKNRDRKRLP